MNKLLVQIILLFFFSSIWAQQFPYENQIFTRNFDEFPEYEHEVIKSSNELIIRIDTIIRHDDEVIYKEIFTYKNDGNPKAELIQKIEYNTWENYLLRTYTYDNSGNMISETLQGWNDGSWANGILYEFTYNENANYLNILVKYWINKSWEKQSLYSYTYDGNTNFWQTQLRQKWENESWVNVNLNTITYDNSGNWLAFLEEEWMIDSWVNISNRSFTYDENGNMLTELGQYWGNNEWINSSSMTYTYDANGNRITLLYEWWQNEILEIFRLETYSYDENNNKFLEIYEYWENNAWVNGVKKEFIFSPGEVYVQLYEWDENNWVEWSSEYSLSISIVMGGEHILNRGADQLELYYTDVTGIENQILSENNSPVHCYPNPANNQITIDIDLSIKGHSYSLELFNQTGQRVKITKLHPSFVSSIHQLNIEDVPAGIYFLKFTSARQTFSQKIIIAK